MNIVRYILLVVIFFPMQFYALGMEKTSHINDNVINKKELFYGSNPYLKDRIPTDDKRYLSFILILELIENRKVKTIVETGTARMGIENFEGDGGSTIIFANWAKQNDAKLFSIDIDPDAVEIASNSIKQYQPNARIVCHDSVQYLESFNRQIDFLYLDSYDYDLEDPFPSQKHHLKEILAAYPKLHENSIVMIDDCDLPYGGKGEFVIDYLLSKGWTILFQDYQVILIRKIHDWVNEYPPTTKPKEEK